MYSGFFRLHYFCSKLSFIMKFLVMSLNIYICDLHIQDCASANEYTYFKVYIAVAARLVADSVAI
jgi:hypothetical protein